MQLAVSVRIGVAMALAAPARDSRLALHYGLAALAACGLVTEGSMDAGMRCNSGRSETLLRRPRKLSPEALNVFSVPMRLNTHLHEERRAMLTLLECSASTPGTILKQALQMITPAEAKAWFVRCCYPVILMDLVIQTARLVGPFGCAYAVLELRKRKPWRCRLLRTMWAQTGAALSCLPRTR